MATESEKIAAEQQYRKVPADWQMEFSGWSDVALLSLSEDLLAATTFRTYAQWTLDYRLAFGLSVGSPNPVLKLRGDGRALELLIAKGHGMRA